MAAQRSEFLIGARRGIARLFPFTVRNRTWTGAGRAYPPFGTLRLQLHDPVRPARFGR